MNFLQSFECPACHQQHNFCHLNVPGIPGLVYEFHCPDKGRMESVTVMSPGKAVHYAPQGAIPLNARSITRQAA